MHINLNNVRTTIRDLTRVAHTCNTSYCHNKNELCPLAIAAGAIVCTTQSRTRLGGATFKFPQFREVCFERSVRLAL